MYRKARSRGEIVVLVFLGKSDDVVALGRDRDRDFTINYSKNYNSIKSDPIYM